MKPRNNKSLFATQCNWIEKIEEDKTLTFHQQASLIVSLSKNAIACLLVEHARAKTLSDPDTRKQFRNIELSTFDYETFDELPAHKDRPRPMTEAEIREYNDRKPANSEVNYTRQSTPLK